MQGVSVAGTLTVESSLVLHSQLNGAASIWKQEVFLILLPVHA